MQRATDLFLLIVAPALAICWALLGLETTPHNVTGWFLFGLGAAYPVAILIDDHARRAANHRPPGTDTSREAARSSLSFWLLLPGFLTAFFAPPLEWMYVGPVLPRVAACQVVGAILILGGLALVTWARLRLRASYSAALRVPLGAHLVQDGPYRIVRHPAYGGLLVTALGVAVGYVSALGLAGIAALLVPALVYRIAVEERLLGRLFEDEYAAYARRTSRLIPGLW